MVVTKEDLIKLLQAEQKKYGKNHPNEIISRNFFRKATDNKYESLIDKEFGTFANYKKESLFKKTTKLKDIPPVERVEDKNRNKRYFISAIIAGADISTEF